MVNRFFLTAVTKLGKLTGRLDWDGAPILLMLTSVSDLQRLSSCKKEPETVAWLKREIRPSDIFYDVGANVGAYSLIAAQLLQGKGKVYSFEPGFANFSTLSLNIIRNDFAETIFPIQTALSDTAGFLTVSFSSIESGAAKHIISTTHKANTQIISVPTLRLDDYIQEFRLSPPTLLKIDVDGGEWQVLQGARKMLTSPTLRSILIEVDLHEPHGTEISAFLEHLGFSLKEKHPRQKGKSDHLFNLIFSRTR